MSDVAQNVQPGNAVNNSQMMSQSQPVGQGNVREQPVQTAQPNQKPIVMQSSKSAPVRFVLVSVGAGGANIAKCLKSMLPNNPFMVAINSSTQDLAVLDGIPDSQKFKIGGPNINGAGKNRNAAKQYYKNFSAEVTTDASQKLDALTAFIGTYEEVIFHPSIQTIVILTFSDDGGTGAGIGPIFGANLTNYVNTIKSFTIGNKEFVIDDVTNTVPRPVVICVTPKCSVNAGAMSLQNAIETKMDIQKAIDAGLGNWFIADNNPQSQMTWNSTEEMYNIINKKIAYPLVKFLGIEMNSDIKCLDLQDKINALRIPGASSFASISEPNEGNLFQYVLPHGQSVARVIPMINYDNQAFEKEKKVDQMLRRLDITAIDKSTAFFQIDKSKMLNMDSADKAIIDTSMIGFFGYKSISTLVEDLKDALHRTMAANAQKENVVRQNSTGFDSIAEDSNQLNDRFSSKAINQANINDLF